jgi:site-specific DNA recombinase
VVTGPILLTGIATCASCSGGMTLRTGKSGRYRYYTCATCAQQGKAACKGRSIPMEKLDRLVTERLADQLLTPERVGKLLLGLMERQTAKNEDYSVRLTALRAKLTDAEGRSWPPLCRNRKRHRRSVRRDPKRTRSSRKKRT